MQSGRILEGNLWPKKGCFGDDDDGEVTLLASSDGNSYSCWVWY
jgi:hypothetical protein